MTNRTGRTTAALNMRSGPGTGHGVVTVLQPFTPLIIEAEQGDWLTVTAGSQQGFVHRNFVTLDPVTEPERIQETAPPAETGRTRSIVNLRFGPGQETRFVRRVPANTPLKIRKQLGNWFRVRLQSDNTKGYIHRDFCDIGYARRGQMKHRTTQTGYATNVYYICAAVDPEHNMASL